MGRIPTGRPKGRPKGTGRLGEVVRLTVRIPEDLYTRFVAFADGRSYHRGDTQLADSVRDALAHYLACPHKRQTKNGTISSEDTRKQTYNGTEDSSTCIKQTYNGTVPSMAQELAELLPLVRDNEQSENSTQSLLGPDNVNLQQTENTLPVSLDTADLEDMPLEPLPTLPHPTQPAPGYDPTKYTLGKLCPRGHDYQGMGQTLLTIGKRRCLSCENAKKREKRQAVPVA